MEEKIAELVNGIIEDQQDLFLIKAFIKGKEPKQKVLVIIDGDHGVTIDQCASISRQLGHQLEELDLINSAYQLEVTSAGVDSPIEMPRQYRKNVGRGVKVTLADGQTLEGELTDAGDDGFVVSDEKAHPRELKFEEVEKTFVKISFK